MIIFNLWWWWWWLLLLLCVRRWSRIHFKASPRSLVALQNVCFSASCLDSYFLTAKSVDPKLSIRRHCRTHVSPSARRFCLILSVPLAKEHLCRRGNYECGLWQRNRFRFWRDSIIDGELKRLYKELFSLRTHNAKLSKDVDIAYLGTLQWQWDKEMFRCRDMIQREPALEGWLLSSFSLTSSLFLKFRANSVVCCTAVISASLLQVMPAFLILWRQQNEFIFGDTSYKRIRSSC